MSKKQNKTKQEIDVTSHDNKNGWYYSDMVKEHFFHPQNILMKDPTPQEFDAVGEVGSPACGDVMKIWIKVDKKSRRITNLKWRTFGCASAIAATSMFSVMLTEKGGLTLEKALKIKPQDIIKRLGGLPDRKIHCSVLADQAFHMAVKNYIESLQ